MIHSREQSFWHISVNLLYKVLLLSWERINSERNKEEVKEKRQCSESKIKKQIYEKSTKAKEKEESLKKKKCGEMTELEESKRKEQERR